jgi:uncharacterized protein
LSPAQPALKQDSISGIFLSSEETRLRAGWRLLLQTALMFLIANCVSIPVVLFLVIKRSIPEDLNVLTLDILLPLEIIEFVVFTSSVFLSCRFLDKRSIVSLGLKFELNSIVDIIVGFLTSAAMMGLIYLIMAKVGWLKFERFSWEADSVQIVIKGVLSYFLLFCMVAWGEELLSRGYHLQTIASGLNWLWGIILSSVIFGLMHLGNPGSGWSTAVGIFFGGLLFGFAYLRTRQLWLPMGIHLGWNFFEGTVFGFPVSGLSVYQLVQNRINGPEIMTGGAFGPEAGLVIIPALIFGALLIYFYTRFRIPST